LREPYSRHLSDGNFELLCKAASDIVRLLYFFHEGKLVIVTNGFVKKFRKTPPNEIALAKQRRK
jgi:phage-related protein